MTLRLESDEKAALQAIADSDDVSLNHVIRRAIRAFLATAAVLASVLGLSACGQEDATQPVSVVQSEAGPSVQPAVVEPSATESATPAAVIQLGVEQVLRVGDRVAGRINVLSYDPADNGVAVEINSGTAPLVVDPAAFTLVDADGTEISGVAAVAAWDVHLAAGEQTMGQIRFAGATQPTTITYAPAGAQPLVWSFS